MSLLGPVRPLVCIGVVGSESILRNGTLQESAPDLVERYLFIYLFIYWSEQPQAIAHLRLQSGYNKSIHVQRWQ